MRRDDRQGQHPHRRTSHLVNYARIWLGSLACAALIAAGGCGGGGNGDSSAPAQIAQTQAEVALPNHLTLSLAEDKTNAAAGDKVTYQIVLTNPTSAAITSTYAGNGTVGANLDALVNHYVNFLVKNAGGRLINPDGSVVTAPPPTPAPQPITFTLQPGQSLSSTQVYMFAQAGVYTAAAALQNPDLSLTPAAGPLTVTVQ